MLDLLLSANIFIDQLLTMGLPAIDVSLNNLLEAMEKFPKSPALGNAISFSKMLGLLLALCMGSYECWMMMLGRRGMDVLKLGRIVALSLCISYSSYICEALKAPGKGLEDVAKIMAQDKNEDVADLERQVADKQDAYLKRLREVQDSIETAMQVQEIGEDAHWWDRLVYNMENLGSTINNYAQRATVAAETKVSEWINDVIRFIGELIFQMSYYGMMVAQRIFMAIMATFAPIMFALSIVPPWSSAWSQWISKYLSLSLWGFVVYMCLYYIDFILMYNLLKDIEAYDNLLKGSVNSWENIGALGLQGIGSNCMYAMGMLVGAYVIRFVPEVASWLIPGGVSSSAGSAAGGVVAGIAGGAVGHTMAAGSSAVSTAASVGGSAAAAAVKMGAAGLGGAVSGARGTSDGGGGTLAGAIGGAAAGMARQAGSSLSNSAAGQATKGAAGSIKDSYKRGRG